MLALGTIETVGLAAAIEAADVACKTADVNLVGYELTKGGGLVVVKVEGQVASVQTAIQAAQAAASLVSRVAGVSVIPRPSEQLELMVRNPRTVGWATGTKASAAKEPEATASEKTAAAGKTQIAEPGEAVAGRSAGTRSASAPEPALPAQKVPAPARESGPAPEVVAVVEEPKAGTPKAGAPRTSKTVEQAPVKTKAGSSTKAPQEKTPVAPSEKKPAPDKEEPQDKPKPGSTAAKPATGGARTRQNKK